MSAIRTIENLTVPAPGVWQIDRSHSDLRITARHLMLARVRGTFEDLAGTINVAENPLESTVEIEAKAASVTTGTTDRDNHLRSADFLDAEQYPLVTFKSTELAPAGDDWRVTGDLTMVGRTRPVSVDLKLEVSADTLRAEGSFVVKQTDFGIKPYSKALGLVKVKDEVRFELRVVAVAVPAGR